MTENVTVKLFPLGDEYVPFEGSDLHRAFMTDVKQHEIRQILKQRFSALLEVGKKLINNSFYPNVSPGSRTLSEQELDSLEEIAPNLVSTNDPLTHSMPQFISEYNELDEHKAYALSTMIRMMNQFFLQLDKLSNDNAFEDLTVTTNEVDPIKALPILTHQHLLTLAKKRLVEESDNNGHSSEEFSMNHLFKKFCEEKKRSVKETTLHHYQMSFAMLSEWYGSELDVREIDKKLAVEIKRKVMERSGMGQNHQALSAKRINAILSNFRTFMTWYLAHSDEDKPNPFSGLDVKENRQTQRFERRKFESNELSQVLNYQFKRSNEAQGFRTAAYWFPILGRYTGMRLNEIAQLTPKQIKLEGEIWLIDLHGASLKTEGSERIIPIHPKLVELGFIEFVKKQRHKGTARVFPELKKGAHSLGDSISRWFNRTMLKNIGINKDDEHLNGNKIDFHCLRKTFSDELLCMGVELSLVKTLMGHSMDDDITYRHYKSSQTDIKVLYDIVCKIK
ncbi:site-specific integrase [Parashewanella tropica]|uniref:site-specific integrase n=1 Tax=Parashewanella tropica TaxID=2547970 RepID=UPI001478DBEA|nr:site-specific integrase [Parashewanella tropica]